MHNKMNKTKTERRIIMKNDRDLLRDTAVTRGWNGHRNESAQKVDPGEEISPAAPSGIRTRDLSIASPAL